jgi:hypothetical protein
MWRSSSNRPLMRRAVALTCARMRSCLPACLLACLQTRARACSRRLELPAVAEHGTAARALAANTAVRRVEEVCAAASTAAYRRIKIIL